MKYQVEQTERAVSVYAEVDPQASRKALKRALRVQRERDNSRKQADTDDDWR